MNFILTNFIYPLEQQVVISKHYNLLFDNPRTEEEIKYVENIIKTSYTSKLNRIRLPIKSKEPILTIERILNDFNNTLCLETKYGKAFLKTFNKKRVYNYIARMWVICRYDDKGEHQKMQKLHEEMREQGELGFFMLDDDSIITKQENILKSYCHILSILLNDSKDYFGGTFLLAEVVDDIRSTSVSRHLNQRLMIWGMGCNLLTANNTKKGEWDDWFYSQKFEKKLKQVTEQIDKSLSKDNSEKVIYIGNVLENASSIFDAKYKLVILVGVLELMLTHNPNFSRFNVEDTIKKQFVLKTSTLVYLYNQSLNLEDLNKRLKVIYDQRSNIAHGNFNEYNKYLKGLSKKEGEEEYFDDLISDTYQYIRAVLTIYFRDKKIVDHLKNG